MIDKNWVIQDQGYGGYLMTNLTWNGKKEVREVLRFDSYEEGCQYVSDNNMEYVNVVSVDSSKLLTMDQV